MTFKICNIYLDIFIHLYKFTVLVFTNRLWSEAPRFSKLIHFLLFQIQISIY